MCRAAVSRLFFGFAARNPPLGIGEGCCAGEGGGEAKKLLARSWLGFSAAEERNFVAPASSSSEEEEEEEEEDGGSFNQTTPAALLCPRCPGRIANF